jgi:hypothetical protein
LNARVDDECAAVQDQQSSRINRGTGDKRSINIPIDTVDEYEPGVSTTFVDSDDHGERAVRAEVGLNLVHRQGDAIHSGPISNLPCECLDFARQPQQLSLAFLREVALRRPARSEYS